MNVMLFLAVILANAICYMVGYIRGVDNTLDEIKRRIKDEERKFE